MLALLLAPLMPETKVLPTRFDLEVTAKDIKRARRAVDNCPTEAAYQCPIAQAMYRMTGRRWGISPCHADLFDGDSVLLDEYKHDGLLFTHEFDRGRAVQPTTIHFWK